MSTVAPSTITQGSSGNLGVSQVLPAMREGFCCRSKCFTNRCGGVDFHWLRLILLSWLMGAICVGIALGLGSPATPVSLGDLGRGDDAFFLIALGCGLYPIGKLLNWFLFKPVYWCSGPGFRDTFVYYVSSFDGLFTHLFWIAGTWGFYFIVFNKDSRSDVVSRTIVMKVEVLFIIMAVSFALRTMLIKYAMASVLRRTYAEKTEQAILFKFFARTLSAPDEKLVANAGKHVEGLLKRVQDSKHSTQSYLRLLRKEGLLMWNHSNKLKKVTTTEKVREYASLAFERVYQRGIQRGLVPDLAPGAEAGGGKSPGITLHMDDEHEDHHEYHSNGDNDDKDRAPDEVNGHEALHTSDVIVPRKRQGSATFSPRSASSRPRKNTLRGGEGAEEKQEEAHHVRHTASGQLPTRRDRAHSEVKRRHSESDKSPGLLFTNPFQGDGDDSDDDGSFMPEDDERHITSAFFRVTIPSSNDIVNRCMQIFDLNNDGQVSESEFTQIFVHMLKVFRGLRSTLSSHKSVSKAVRIASDVILWIFLFIVGLAIFDVPLADVFVPFSATLVAISFAIGSTVQNLLASLLVVVVLRPFDVGDRVLLPYVVDSSMVVAEISVLTTKMTCIDGKTYYIPNSMLLTQYVINYRRSSTCVWRTAITVGFGTSRAQLDALRGKIEEYLGSRPREWAPDCAFNMDSASPLGELTMVLWTSQRIPWSLGASAFKSRSDLLMYITEALKELKITYVRPIQPIEVVNSTHKAGSSASGGPLPGLLG